MIPEAVEGGATFNASVPQPKGWPTRDNEIICYKCGQHDCSCGTMLGDTIYEFQKAYGIPLPYRTAHNLAAHLKREGLA